MGKKGPLWWRESDWLLRGSSAANQILLRHSGPILSLTCIEARDVSALVYIAKERVGQCYSVLMIIVAEV